MSECLWGPTGIVGRDDRLVIGARSVRLGDAERPGGRSHAGRGNEETQFFLPANVRHHLRKRPQALTVKCMALLAPMCLLAHEALGRISYLLKYTLIFGLLEFLPEFVRAELGFLMVAEEN